jgi:hypothetical protein
VEVAIGAGLHLGDWHAGQAAGRECVHHAGGGLVDIWCRAADEVQCPGHGSVPEGAMEESPRGLDDEHPEQPMRSRQSPNGTHAVSLLPFRIVAPPAALAEGS